MFQSCESITYISVDLSRQSVASLTYFAVSWAWPFGRAFSQTRAVEWHHTTWRRLSSRLRAYLRCVSFVLEPLLMCLIPRNPSLSSSSCSCSCLSLRWRLSLRPRAYLRCVSFALEPLLMRLTRDHLSPSSSSSSCQSPSPRVSFFYYPQWKGHEKVLVSCDVGGQHS